MIKTTLAAALLALAFTAPAFAAEMAHTTCDTGTMKMVHEAMDKDTDPKMAKDVKKAAKEMMMADESMKAHKMDDCSKHIGMAMDHMMMKHN